MHRGTEAAKGSDADGLEAMMADIGLRAASSRCRALIECHLIAHNHDVSLAEDLRDEAGKKPEIPLGGERAR